MSREVLRYPRADGVMLTATLYLPPEYNKERDGPLPCIFWAYPREYKSKEAAGQNTRSSQQFSYISSMSPTLWAARGYAVLDGPTLPIVAEGDEEPNDTFIAQLVDEPKQPWKVSEGVLLMLRGFLWEVIVMVPSWLPICWRIQTSLHVQLHGLELTTAR
ncbi:hypothetical protein CEUSTIGMA_g3118.t1 [Chlamydomonas eustigma]|uniref:Uncharacterized protein n=1 Tax=Chlamydomonas eustigma TaxID=1157962 RepID=A0A250WY14_9CHLO|nr:hypothetical protein CEUSTIGMA_g3118.t1 [Chlamydomonas eustigma]|eukprot:GAX75675.1 hypothetical protein CEUSTIGMA_g3118.t1 [Chlamydomonas eustigma]